MLPTQRCVEPDHLSYKGLLTHCVGSGISPLLPTGAPLLPLLGWAPLGRTYGKQALVWQGIGGVCPGSSPALLSICSPFKTWVCDPSPEAFPPPGDESAFHTAGRLPAALAVISL